MGCQNNAKTSWNQRHLRKIAKTTSFDAPKNFVRTLIYKRFTIISNVIVSKFNYQRQKERDLAQIYDKELYKKKISIKMNIVRI